MVRSFRLRLALWSALIAGVALAAFAGAAWWSIREARLERIDVELKTQAQRALNRPPREIVGGELEVSLAHTLGNEQPHDVAVMQVDDEDSVFRSAHWPADVSSASLPWPPARRGLPPARPDMASEWDRPPRDAERAAPWLREPGSDVRRPEQPGPPAVTVVRVNTLQGNWHLALVAGGSRRIAVGVASAVIDAEMASVRNSLLLAVPLALSLIGLGAWLVSNRALQSVHRVTDAIRKVGADALDRRIEAGDEDREYAELIEVFNEMLERLERSFQQASRFSADAAHELKTPLAILQGQLERALRELPAGSPMQRTLTSILDEVRRLSMISRKLLLLSLADAGRLRLHRTPFDLSRALEDLAEDARMLSTELDIRTRIEPGLNVEADADLLRQLMHNLISNAVKYNVASGWIEIAGARNGPLIDVRVTNASRGIAPAQRARLFERFYRGDGSHSRRIEGVGLGLSVAREIARAHGGELSLRESAPGTVSFWFTLPASAQRVTAKAAVDAAR